MPKKRKGARRQADTLRVPSVPVYRADGGRIASLLVVQGAPIDLGRQVLCNRPITLGRDEEAEMSLRDGSISRLHCRIERDAQSDGYILIDLGSTNGTSVNGRRVERYPLTEGDKIFLGSSVLRFSFADAVDLDYQSRLAEMVTTDALTGLASKRQYDATFEVYAEQALANGSELTVLVMDMDGLKPINDTHGHEMGGFVIVEVSHILREVLGEHGTLCRFGGDEFVGCFPGLSRDSACRLAEEARRRVAEHNFVRDGVRVEPTLSVGVAAYPHDTESPARLFAAADRALYRAKGAGRNRVATIDSD